MRVSKYWHSCLLAEEGDTRILIDPGKYSFLPGRAKAEDFTELTAILITHEHGDHADPEIIRKILHKNPVPVYGNGGVLEALRPFGVEVELLADRVVKIGRIQVEAISAAHGPLLENIPPNNAYLLDGAFLAPGDSYDHVLAKLNVRALALPVTAPWGKITEAYELLKKISPKFAVPIHDGYIREEFLAGQYEMWANVCRDLDVDFRPLRTPREFLEV